MQLKKMLFLLIHSSQVIGKRQWCSVTLYSPLWRSYCWSHLIDPVSVYAKIIYCSLSSRPTNEQWQTGSLEKMTHTLLTSTDKKLLRLWGPAFLEVKFFAMQYPKHTIRVCLPLFNFNSISEQNNHISEICLLYFMVLTIVITNFSKHSSCILLCTDGFRYKIQWCYSRRTVIRVRDVKIKFYYTSQG